MYLQITYSCLMFQHVLYNNNKCNKVCVQLLSHFIGLSQNDVKVSLTQGSLAFRVEREIYSLAVTAGSRHGMHRIIFENLDNSDLIHL